SSKHAPVSPMIGCVRLLRPCSLVRRCRAAVSGMRLFQLHKSSRVCVRRAGFLSRHSSGAGEASATVTVQVAAQAVA
ncbi:MAG: hypothetical protein L0Z50_08155, partial [Verrucomicrobiales bacterium]|nr:hypothetical protein [Verrucomicrobiales bacterium]